MVTTIKVLKRKDASSVVAAVAMGLIIFNLVNNVATPIAQELDLSSATAATGEWQALYLLPVVNAILQLLFLEVVLWAWTTLAASMKK